MRLSLLSSVAFGLVLLTSTSAFADHDDSDAHEASSEAIGTTPARKSVPQAAQPRPAPMPTVDRASSAGTGGYDDETDVREEYSKGDGRRYRGGEAPIATAPPPDWAVLHAGLRPQLGTFGGIATFALAHARTERFYGGFSFSAVRNDAGLTVAAAQLGLGRNLSDEFRGGLQFSLTENRARDFIGIGQTALAYNRAGEMVGVTQLAAFNRASEFTGIAQLGGYNRTDVAFNGLAQIGGFNHSKKDFTGAFQLGVMNGTGRLMHEGDDSKRRFAGLAQIGVANSAQNFYGITQVGAASFTGSKFGGVVQIGALAAYAQDFTGLAQIGGVVASEQSRGLQIGAGAINFREHNGLQLGVLGNYSRDITGAQIGVVNIAREVKGVQIGVFNEAKSLRGLQIGLANHAEDGVLPWTTLLNFGFGDGDGGDVPNYNQYKSASAHRYAE